MTVFCYIAGGICILYCLIIGIFVGHSTNFFLIWGILGLLLTAFGFLYKKGLFTAVPSWFRITFLIMLTVGAGIFVAVEGCIVSSFSAVCQEELDYVIVLGAQAKESGPSKTLKMRLDTAYDYLVEHERTCVIVSGGQGPDEPMSEAECMRRYLEERGIEASRILMEDRSRNTVQNIEYSGRLFRPESDKVGIISNNFHMFRALGLARHAGYKHVRGISAPSERIMLPNNMLREFFGVIKDFVFGNLA